MSQIAVTRSRNGVSQSFASISAAMRVIAGTPVEIRWSEASAIRASLRAGNREVRDSLGFVWDAVGEVRPFVRRSRSAVAVASAYRWEELTFGVEIECIAPSSDAINAARNRLADPELVGWRAVHDGSINSGSGFGIEFVSPILKGEEGIASVQVMTRILNELGFRVNASCGLHVHVGARPFSPTELLRIAGAFVKHERHFDALVPMSRRGNSNRYCQSVANRQMPANVRGIRSIAYALNGGYEPNRHYTSRRYHKLNFQPYARLGTIEFRHHSGTTDGKKISNWVRLVTGFSASAANGSFGPTALDFTPFIAACVDSEIANALAERAMDLEAA